MGSNNLDELVAAARVHLPGLLVATDFDGTLAPIVADPGAARPAAGAIDALRDLAAAGAQIGVITGRDAGTVVRLGGFDAVPGVIVEGLYGAERWQAGSLQTVEVPESIAALREALPAWLQTVDASDGVWIEDKRLSLVIHTRPAPDPVSEQLRLRPLATELARRLGLELHDGRAVLEFRLPGYDKGGALHRLVAETQPTAVLFAGDDAGDIPAFEALRALRMPAWGVLAGSPEARGLERVADVVVDGPEGVLDVLRRLSKA